MKKSNRKLQIGIIGSAGYEEYPGQKPDKRAYRMAYDVGRLVAQKGAILVCGGKGGIMEEACRGAKDNDGTTVGVISGNERGKANKYVDVEIVSGMVNCGEEALIISMSDGLIAIGGGAGTLQEIATAYRNKKAVVAIQGISGWSDKVAGTFLDERKLAKIQKATSPNQAVKLLLDTIQ